LKKIQFFGSILILLFLTACGAFSADLTSAPCALNDLPYPRPEPAYTGKLPRDFSAFTTAIEAYTPDQRATREALVSGKNILELQSLLESGELTSVDLVVYYIERIQRYDVDKLNSVLELNPEVLEIAETLDDERAGGSVRGLMHGIPVLLKDNIATGDQLHTAAGAAAMLSWDPDRDAFLVSQLRDAGAIIMGKANLSEWANYMDSCLPNGFSATGGQTQNPYGPFETYGSSSGSAVSVAADLVTVSVGSETQGSLIMPAGINSVVGLKTSRGLVSGDYIIPLLSWQDVPGPIGRNVTDIAVFLSAMTGVDENDPNTQKAAALAGTDFTQFLLPEAANGVRVGIPIYSEERIEKDVTETPLVSDELRETLRQYYLGKNSSLRALGGILEPFGIEVIEVDYDDIPDTIIVVPALEYGYKEDINQFLLNLGDQAPVASLEAIIAYNNEDLSNRAPYGQDYLEASQNTAVTAEEYEQMKTGNQETAVAGLNNMFDTYNIDVIISDVSQTYAPAGFPAITVPIDYGADGTPQGIVFVGKFLGEPQLIAVAYAFEQATQERIAPNLEATMRLIEAMGETSP